MSLKYFFFFVLFVVSAYATKCDITHSVEHDGDVTDSEVKESENGVEVSGWVFFYFYKNLKANSVKIVITNLSVLSLTNIKIYVLLLA